MTESTSSVAGSNTRATFLFAVLLLFFFQLTGVWIENIYRMSLIKLEMGKELLGSLFLFAPLSLFLVREKHERGFLKLTLGVLLAARASVPLLGASALIIVAGLGMAAFLMVLSYALSDRYRHLQGDMGAALGLAVLASITLRNWGSSLDVSTDGTTGIAIGTLLVLFALYLVRGVMRVVPEPATTGGHLGRRALAMIGLFANFACVTLVLSSPAVVNAWAGGDSHGYSMVVICTAVTFAAALIGMMRPWSRGVLIGWNVLFMASLLGGILLLTPQLPVSPESSPTIVKGDAPPARFALYIALLFSPIVICNVRHAAQYSCGRRPRHGALPVTLGMAFLFGTTMLLIFTNVWGYVPYGELFRNKFYLPFLIFGVVMCAPYALGRTIAPQTLVTTAQVRVPAIVLVIAAIAGVFWSGSSKPLPKSDESRLTVMTYNMQQGSREDGDRHYRGQLALLRKVNADIIGLEECDTPRPSGGSVDAVRYFADGLGYFAYYGPNTISGTFGAALLSRYPIRNPYAFFTYSKPDEVGTAAAEIDVNGQTIAFFVNHPAGGDAVMNAHVDALIAEVTKYPRVFAVGDYNFTADEPFFAKLVTVLTPSAATLGEANVNFHGRPKPLARAIDHIFVSPAFRVIESHYLAPPESETDHPAHWSVLEIEH
ncbi:MAG: endonuclease/exonuclease/phosphatase family protein [Candidatus Hydrogenedentes bacterium]|nr:endonuclease/exonuclease/phosphatase family protein [Candidatus Hydrogenedentota bacterium]